MWCLVARRVAAMAAPPANWDAARGVFVGDRAAADVAIPSPLWIFGYGSLVWKPEPGWEGYERADGVVSGWGRYFSQKSMDHRGTPASPGLVCSMIPDAALEALGCRAAGDPPSRTRGSLYRVPDGDAEAVLADLDFREKGGYSRALATADVGGRPVAALVYSANEANPNFVRDLASHGDDAVARAAAVIATAAGPSGRNDEYVLRLCDAIPDDDYLRRLGAAVRFAAPGA